MQYNEYVTFIENLSCNIEEHDDEGKGGEKREETNAQIVLMRGLLQAFDKKFWITVTSILLRLWKVYSLPVLLLSVLLACFLS